MDIRSAPDLFPEPLKLLNVYSIKVDKALAILYILENEICEMQDDRDEEYARHWQLIRTPLKVEWSGRTRYAAAMYFYNLNELTADELEIYRICSQLDHEDPLKIMADRGIGKVWIGRFRS